jgi:hypothetical protein
MPKTPYARSRLGINNSSFIGEMLVAWIITLLTVSAHAS